MSVQLETMKPEDLKLPENGIVFILEGDTGMSMAYLGSPPMTDQLRAEAIYKLVTENAAVGKKMMTTVIRGLAVLNNPLH